jgi:L-ascorbate metabolism protein UlaG (beta-lactamase superfamily)
MFAFCFVSFLFLAGYEFYFLALFCLNFLNNTEDAVLIHRDTRSKRSIGMHWGTFSYSDEDIMDPPRELAAYATKHKLGPKEFVAIKHGETVMI